MTVRGGNNKISLDYHRQDKMDGDGHYEDEQYEMDSTETREARVKVQAVQMSWRQRHEMLKGVPPPRCGQNYGSSKEDMERVHQRTGGVLEDCTVDFATAHGFVEELQKVLRSWLSTSQAYQIQAECTGSWMKQATSHSLTGCQETYIPTS